MRTSLLLSAALLFSGCAASQYNTLRFRTEPKSSIAVLPLDNYTESPLAGLKAASISAAILSTRGLRVEDKFSGTQERSPGDAELKRLMSEFAAANTAYTLTGSVNEWKYKAGLDGEPTVSFTLRLFENRGGTQVWTSVVSRTGAPSQSTGVLAQKLLEKALSELK